MNTNADSQATTANAAAQPAVPAKTFFDEEFTTTAGRAFKLGIYVSIVAAPFLALSVIAARLSNSNNA